MISNFDIYLICNIENIKFFFTFIGTLLLIGGNLLLVFTAIELDSWDDEEKSIKKPLIILNTIVLVCLFFGFFMPNRETLIYMQVNKILIKENINFTTTQINELVDYIIQKIGEIAKVMK